MIETFYRGLLKSQTPRDTPLTNARLPHVNTAFIGDVSRNELKF